MNGRLNFLSVCTVIFLSFILIIITAAVPFYFSIAAVTKSETVVKIVQKVDYKKIVESNESLKKTAERFNIKPQTVDDIMKSEAAGKIIETYADEAAAIILDLPSDGKFNVDTVKSIVTENIDEITDIALKSTGIQFKEEYLQKQILTVVDKNAESIVKAFPDLNEVKVIVETVKASQLIKKALNPLFAVVLLVIVLIISAAIFFLRLKGFNGLLWLGIDYAISAVLTAAIIIFNKSAVINTLALKLSDLYTEIASEAVSLCNDRLGVGFLVLLVLSVICIIAFTALYDSSEKNEITDNSQEDALPLTYDGE